MLPILCPSSRCYWRGHDMVLSETYARVTIITKQANQAELQLT